MRVQGTQAVMRTSRPMRDFTILEGRITSLSYPLSQFMLVLRKIMKAPMWWGFLKTVIMLERF